MVETNLNSITNTELFRLFVQEKNKEAISVFFQNQSDLFYRVALKYTKNSADAEDVVQASFLRIMDKADQYKGLQTAEERLLQSWCLTIVVHCALKKIKSESIRKRNETSYSAQINKPFEEETNMEKNAENEKIHKIVKDAIIQLPEKYRIPIHLKYVEGFELEAIAGILKVNGNTLRSIIKRGLDKISEQLKAEKITLSSAGVIGMIQGMPLEHAPVTVKTMASKLTMTANSSRRLAKSTSVKNSWLSFKSIFLTLAGSIAIAGGVYSLNQPKAVILPTPVVSNPIPEPSKIERKDTNEQWLGGKEIREEIVFLINKFEGFSNDMQGVYAEKNRPIFYSLPIPVQEKPFVLECVVSPQINKDSQGAKLLFQGYWVKDNMMIEHEFWANDDRYTLTTTKHISQQIYFYKNLVCSFVNGKCYRIGKYNGDLSNVKAAVLSRNFVYSKIVSKTLDQMPEEILKEINKHLDKPTIKQQNWIANESNLFIND